MCLIIQKPEMVTLNPDKFKVAVKNNDDGYGISYPDPDNAGKLITIRDHNKIDVKDTIKFINNDLKKHRALIHLRYTTAGETTLRNAHPFPILEYEQDGVDLRMAHNGTLYAYKPNANAPNKGESDTRVFVREYVRPLFKRLIKGMSPEELLLDPFVGKLLNKELTTKSVVCFIDGFGNTLEVNALGNGGYYLQDCGAYFSNAYSFDPTHREPPSYNNWGTGGYSYNSGFQGGTHAGFKGEQKHKKKEVERKEKQRTNNTKHAEDTQVEKFTDKYAISREDLLDMTDDMIEMLVEGADQAEAVALLIKELLFELATMEGAIHE